MNDCITMFPGCAILQLQKQNDPKTNIFGLKSKTWIVGVLRLFVSARNYNLFTFILQVPYICAVVSQLDIISPYSWPTVPQNLKCKMGLSLAGASISHLCHFQSCQCKMPNFKCKMDLSLDGASISLIITVSFQSCECKI